MVEGLGIGPPTTSKAQTLCWRQLPCGHLLHLACLKLWSEQQQTCPTCRAPFEADSHPLPSSTSTAIPNLNRDATSMAAQPLSEHHRLAFAWQIAHQQIAMMLTYAPLGDSTRQRCESPTAIPRCAEQQTIPPSPEPHQVPTTEELWAMLSFINARQLDLLSATSLPSRDVPAADCQSAQPGATDVPAGYSYGATDVPAGYSYGATDVPAGYSYGATDVPAADASVQAVQKQQVCIRGC